MINKLTLSGRIAAVLLSMAFLMPFLSPEAFAQTKKSDAKVTRTVVGTVNAGGAFPGQAGLPSQLRRLLSNSFGELETEDLLLLLILYLLYRESGDQDWLMTLGAMLFLP